MQKIELVEYLVKMDYSEKIVKKILGKKPKETEWEEYAELEDD